MNARSAIVISAIFAIAACAHVAPPRADLETPGLWRIAAATAPPEDGEIRHAVKNALRADPALDGALIAVSARDGEVTLAGVVVSSEQRYRAQQLTAATQGVRGVDNVLEVEPIR